MRPVFTASEMRALDARAIEQLGIPGPRLMEHAGAGAAHVIAREFAPISGQARADPLREGQQRRRRLRRRAPAEGGGARASGSR